MLPLLIVLSPFMQIGLTYYLSVHALLMVLSTGYLVRCFTRTGGVGIGFGWFLLLVGFMFSSILFVDGVRTEDLLRGGRELLSLIVIVLWCVAVRTQVVSLERVSVTLVRQVLLLVSTLMFFLSLIQTVFLSRGVYVGLSQDWFVINTATLPSYLDLMYSRIRPMGTFGEPSYLSAFSLILLFAIRERIFSDRRWAVIALCLTFCVLLSRSFSGIFWLALGSCLYLFRIRAYKALIWIGGLALVGTFASVLFVPEVWGRAMSILSGNDPSFNIRILAPLHAVPAILAYDPFGIPPRLFHEFGGLANFSISDTVLVQNGLLNIVITYGVLGIACLVALLYFFRGGEYFWLLMVLGFQNGSFLSFDKVVMVAIALMGASVLSSNRVGRAE
ncbi:hypothetical protein Q4485_16035 [Granulosicoccaceae sp. 1_MG-2023]|nr:hypothetical protein [Granulosicoccaceae sp. 1_MG-2023]